FRFDLQSDKNLHLDVPAYRKMESYTCVPSCCKMMLDYLNNVTLIQPTANLEEPEITSVMNSKIDGTHLRDVANINDLLTASNPSVEFIPEFQYHQLA